MLRLLVMAGAALLTIVAVGSKQTSRRPLAQ